jgi:1,4-dihydroxy-2-naphthoyl-CoA hydrolase
MDLDAFSEIGAKRFPGHLGVRVTEAGAGRARGEFDVGREHHAPNGYLHAGAIVGLADTVCGYGCLASLPEDASGFTTIELKTNFLGTALEGTVVAEATMVHGGRTTQVWDAVVRADGRTLALFRCTQLVLYPRD